MTNIHSFCRSCLQHRPPERTSCASCAGRRFATHAELDVLSVAHVDCDAFYAAIEKRDDPSLKDRPVIVGGGARGVVSTACYVARTYGVRSAMPMYKALALCPDAAVIRPNMNKYVEVARALREMMRAITPLVEPVSIDEAFLDLAGTERVHGAWPSRTLARFQNEVESKVGVSVSIGLSWNKFLAKLASDFDKPRGFSMIGRAETQARLAPLPVAAIWGVGPAMAATLARDGFVTLADLQSADAADLARRYGDFGLRLARLSRGDDRRTVEIERETKSVSAETTFARDLSDGAELERILWALCEKVSARTKAAGLAGKVVTLKLKDASFRTVTRRITIDRPSNLAHTLFSEAARMLAARPPGRAWRLIGVGYSGLSGADQSDTQLFDAPDERLQRREQAIDGIRARFGGNAIASGRKFKRRAD